MSKETELMFILFYVSYEKESKKNDYEIKMNNYRFDGVNFMRRMRGKKIMLVGDSLSLNMFESLACLLHASLPNAKYSLHRSQPLTSLTFQVLPFFVF